MICCSSVLLCDVFVSGDRELARGNLNPHPVEAEQLTPTVSGEVELTLDQSSPCWWKDIKVGWHNATVHPEGLSDHMCLFGCNFEYSVLCIRRPSAKCATQRTKHSLAILVLMPCLLHLGYPLLMEFYSQEGDDHTNNL